MKYIIDGYNLLFRSLPDLDKSSLQTARQKLISYLNEVTEGKRISITVVFDSSASEADIRRSHSGLVEIIYTAKGVSADQYILDHCRYSRHCTVVTSDKQLSRLLTEKHVKKLSIESFLSLLSKKAASRNHIMRSRTTTKKPRASTEAELPPLSDLEAWEVLFTSQQDTHEKTSG